MGETSCKEPSYTIYMYTIYTLTQSNLLKTLHATAQFPRGMAAACHFPWFLFDPTVLLNLLNGYHNQLAPALFCCFGLHPNPCTPVGMGGGCRGSLSTLCSQTCFPFLPSSPSTPFGRRVHGLSARLYVSHTWGVDNKWISIDLFSLNVQ